MPVSLANLNQELYDVLLSRGYDPVALQSNGDPENDIEGADLFRFTFGKDKNDQPVPAWVTIENDTLMLYIDNNFTKIPNWSNFTEFMKRWAQGKFLKWETTNRDRLMHDMKKRTVMKKKEDQLNEGYYALGKKASYNDSIPTVKMIIQHTRNLEEGEQRFRNVARIFVETASGERFLLPTNRPGLARVYARHIAEGGTPYDDRAKHINTLVEEYTKMAGFVRATRNGQFNESAGRLVQEGVNHYNNLRETLTRMAGHRGYNSYFESYTPVLNEEADDSATLNELFVQEKLDPRIESVMPILQRLSKNITEMSEVKELDEWAQSILEVEDETTKTLAEPATDMLEGRDVSDQIESVKNAVTRRIMMQHPKLLKDLDNLEMAIADAASSFVGDGIEELGSSDISAIVNDVERRMEERHSDIDEAPGAETLKHNQDTEKSNLKAFDLAEGPADEPVEPDMDADDKRWDDVEMEESATMPKDDPRDNLDRLDPEHPGNRGMGRPLKDKIKQRTGQDVYGQGRAAAGMKPIHHYANKPNLPEEEVEEGVVDTLKKVGKKVADYIAPSDEQLLKDLQKKIGIPKHAQHGKPGMAKPNEGVEEDLDANQKRVGQLGPTEPVGKNEKNLRGKLVGASESTESTEEAITEMDSPGPNDDPWAKGGKATPIKADQAKKNFLGVLQKSVDKHNTAKQATDKNVAQHMKEGQDDLDAILRIVRK